ncbi:hypothetical protein [Caballeronia sp. Lep1P3]|uniref:hypothetical protein n=1 Tax=Caballeronia sp. Lep1P3 TaxID=2878150 RepID=UPI001FD1E1AF|nr:hypothetical protein [Caballeronia sp. Lep1P3]
MKSVIGVGLAACAGLACEAALAGVSVGVNLGVPVYAAPQPVYAAPAPVYAEPPPPPPPVVYQPAPPPPVVYQQAPVVVAPAPAIAIGWYGDRYWDGYRYWDRRDWYAHHGGYGHRHW